MLTPMMVQYLVGLCCLRHDPDAVEITVGDMVYDKAAQKKRDVDVTITFKNEDDLFDKTEFEYYDFMSGYRSLWVFNKVLQKP